MIDIAKQIAYWRVGAEEDWVVAQKLVADESIRHGLFFAHLALEKILKAHVSGDSGYCTQDTQPVSIGCP